MEFTFESKKAERHDVGANIGDIGISFIHYGVKRAIGLEQFLINYKYFKSNIKKII